ncbi:MAG: acyl-ACP--UDP-N-acetylglucosamine O-acyltransferase [Vampirovibrionales bacterium]
MMMFAAPSASALIGKTTIHPTAVIDPSAVLEDGVTIGPYAVVGPECHVGQGCVLESHAVLQRWVRLGRDVRVDSHATVGGAPQDLKYKGERSWVEVGDGTQLRECVTIHRPTGEDLVTKVGSDCLLMAYSHVAHNAEVEQGVIMANAVQLGGHSFVGQRAFIGGACVVQQGCRVGEYAIMGGFGGTRQDIPPFAKTAGGGMAVIQGINSVGLRRAGMSLQTRKLIQEAFNLLFFEHANLSQGLAQLEASFPIEETPELQKLIAFVKSSTKGFRAQSKRAMTHGDGKRQDATSFEFEDDDV